MENSFLALETEEHYTHDWKNHLRNRIDHTPIYAEKEVTCDNFVLDFIGLRNII
jgi:hypothetical protein